MLRRVLKFSLLILLAMLSAVGGVMASIAVSAMTIRPTLFMSAGVVAFVAIYGCGMLLSLYWKKKQGAKRRGYAELVPGALVFLLFAVTLLVPPFDSRQGPRPVEGVQYWELETGSRIGYVHLPAESTNGDDQKKFPVVHVHGGPGTPDMAGDADYFGQLTTEGYDVYVYDKVGTGYSERLDDPRQYTVERDVTDLEAIRKQIGAERLMLISHSYGGTVVANYMAEYGAHVEKAIFSSPGAVDPDDTSGGNLTSRLRTQEQINLFRLLLYPRVLFTYTLLQVNPQAAIAFAGDAEMDARFDKVYAQSESALHCADKGPGPHLTGLGFYAHQFPQSATAKQAPDPREALAGSKTPILIVKGGCDYLSWPHFLQSLENSMLVYLPQAGHNTYQDEPALFMEVLQAYLAGEPLPVTPYEEAVPPQDYEGIVE
ncbi:hypothetical protein CEN49_25460 [Fischerella thermalis CCMEE 5273]|nr:hypothetical protein CEN49_25460 [Fischerella thermalis CCMEE 5273]